MKSVKQEFSGTFHGEVLHVLHPLQPFYVHVTSLAPTNCLIIIFFPVETFQQNISNTAWSLLELAYGLFYSFARFESDPSSSASEEGSDAEDKPKHKEKEKKKKSPEKKRKAASSKSASPKKKAKISVCIHTFCSDFLNVNMFIFNKTLNRVKLFLSLNGKLVKRKQKQH